MDTTTSVKASFSGGLQFSLGDSTKLPEDTYVFLSNGRNVSGVISPIRGAVTTNMPEGALQGLYGFGDYFLVFVSGNAYYRKVADSQWKQIFGVNLDVNAPYVYAEAVPASTINRERTLINTDNLDAGVKFSLAVPGTPSGVVISDGVTQPYILFGDGYARRTATYAEWQLDGNREYVPVGITNLLWANGKLYGVKNGAVISSVTGRPLDFVTLINAQADKEPGEDAGGAEATGHRADYATPVALFAAGTEGGDLVLGTTNNVYLLTPNFTFTIAGEHTFNQRLLSDVGLPGPFGGVAITNDFAFVDLNGPKTLGELATLGKTAKEGKKDKGFSAAITDLFADVTQEVTDAVNFEGYAYFLVNSAYGAVVLVWDLVGEVWVSVDKYTEVTNPKFLAVARDGNASAMYIGGDDGIWHCFAGTTDVCKFYPMEIVKLLSDEEQKVKQDIKLGLVHLCFVSVFEDGVVSITPYAGGHQATTASATLLSNASRDTSMPFARRYTFSGQRFTLATPEAETSWRSGAMISWNVDADLSYVALEHNVMKSNISYGHQSSIT